MTTASREWSAAARPWRVIVATSQLGYRPESPKTVSLLLKGEGRDLPDKIPFFVQRFGDRRARVQPGRPKEWTDTHFRWPFDLVDGELTNDGENYGAFWSTRPQREGVLQRTESRWGPVWQADFSDFRDKGIFQIETELRFSTPFVVRRSRPVMREPSCRWATNRSRLRSASEFSRKH